MLLNVYIFLLPQRLVENNPTLGMEFQQSSMAEEYGDGALDQQLQNIPYSLNLFIDGLMCLVREVTGLII